MRIMFKMAAVVSVVMAGSASMLAGCQGSQKSEDEAMCEKPKPGTITTVNEYCVVNLADPVDPSISETWKGQKVGFCCKGCLPKWTTMTEAQKDAAVASAVSKGKVKG